MNDNDKPAHDWTGRRVTLPIGPPTLDEREAPLLARIAEQGIEMTLEDEVFNNLAEAGFDPAYGARPLKRLIQRMIENPLAEAILSGAVDQTRPVVVAMSDQGLVFKCK